MSSIPTNQEQSPVARPRKRYKLYIKDSTCPIPLRTLDRWNKSIRDNNTNETSNEVTSSEDNNFSNTDNIIDYESELSEDSENESTSRSKNPQDSSDSSDEEIIVNSAEEDCDNNDNNELENDNYDQLDLNEREDNDNINANIGAQNAINNLCNLANRSNIMLYEGSKITIN
ncbi:GSCOCG00008230001-RA-CDS, partial [Cotesia congregata]